MSKKNTVVRSMHDLGAAVWLGGTLMGDVGLNGAASNAADKQERAKIASDGWARWTPVNTVAIGAHLVGSVGMLLANRDRVREQSGATANTVVKTTVTGLALAATAYSRVLGKKIEAMGTSADSKAATTPSEGTPDDVAAAQRQLQMLQWAIPALTAVIVALGAQQGEQQRPEQILEGMSKKARSRRWSR